MIPDHELGTKVREEFNIIDWDKTGVILVKEMKNAILKTGIEISKQEVNQIIKEMDFDRNGKISYSEFVSCVIDLDKHLTDGKIRAVFNHFD